MKWRAAEWGAFVVSVVASIVASVVASIVVAVTPLSISEISRLIAGWIGRNTAGARKCGRRRLR